MKVLPGIALVVVSGAAALGAGMTSLEVGGNEYTNISDVHVSGNGGVFISAANGMIVVSADTLPDDFLASWNISRESAANAAEKKSEEVQARQSQALSA